MQSLIDPSGHVSDHVNTLSGLRIFAALAIVLFHLPGLLWLPAGTFTGIQLNQGVSFFYVLSGFILQHSYRQRIGFVGGITPIQFIALRFFRLWPCHIAVLVLLIVANGPGVLNYFLHTYSTGQIFSAVFLLQAWNPDLKVVFALNGPAWAISVEMFFYALFPLLCRQGLISPLRPALLGGGLTVAWLTAIWLYMPNGNFETLAGTNPLARMLEFSVGISAYEYFSKRRFRSGTWLEIGALALVALSVAKTPIVAWFVGNKLGLHLMWWLGNCFSFWAFTVVIVVFFWQKGGVSKFMGWKPAVYLGEISFTLYLVHQPLLLYLSQSAPWFHKLPLPMQVVAFAIIVLGLSAALHHLIEKPCTNITKRLILRSKSSMCHTSTSTKELTP